MFGTGGQHSKIAKEVQINTIPMVDGHWQVCVLNGTENWSSKLRGYKKYCATQEVGLVESKIISDKI